MCDRKVELMKHIKTTRPRFLGAKVGRILALAGQTKPNCLARRLTCLEGNLTRCDQGCVTGQFDFMFDLKN